MQKIALLCGLALVAPLAQAQIPSPSQEQGRVLSVTPVVQQVGIPQQVCSPETVYQHARPSGAGALLGAIAGGAVGNAVGGGGGRAAATALGLVGGALLGNQIEGPGAAQYQTVPRCTTEIHYENRTLAYDVVYEYAGRPYTTRTANDPGPWIAVSVQPLATRPGPAYAPPPPGYGPAGWPASAPRPGWGPPSYPMPAATPPGYGPPPATVIDDESGRPYTPQRAPYGR
ncbi:MAG: hypothetical protein PHI55_09355 [Burkholderiaceae bacterium]|nr:hypothetical protein [Burkholderiaceae bacterium]